MKTINVKKIGAIVGTAAIVGAALAAPVSAGLNFDGVDKTFFYDSNYNPTVQIVVGDGGLATDAIAAGNIAATIGNLAYMTTTESISPELDEGEVIIETAALGATGDYVQDGRPDVEADNTDKKQRFYDEDEGYTFNGGQVKYERGDFTQYALMCDQQTQEEAGVLLEGTYSNIHCLFCKTLCIEGLKNPEHDMKEVIEIDTDKIKYYEEGLNDNDREQLRMSLDKNAIKYTVETGYIPLDDMEIDDDEYADFEYRGKIIFMGKEYFVKDITSDKIYLAEGMIIDDISSEGYVAEYDGYKFKVDNLIYSNDYIIAGILLDIEKPDGTTVQTQISKMSNGAVDNLEISGVYAKAQNSVEQASIIVYNKDTEIVLEDGEDLELGGVTYEGWKVEWLDYADTCDSFSDCDIGDYEDVDVDVLEKIVVTYDEAHDGSDALGIDESIIFPAGKFQLTFMGYRGDNFVKEECSGGEDRILLEKGEPYQLLLSFTGDDGTRFDEIRMDEGLYERGDQFILSGGVWEYEKYDKNSGTQDRYDTVEITRTPQLSGSKEKITLNRICDPDMAGLSTLDNCTVGSVPTCGCDGLDITLREMALTDAIEDDDTDYENDDDIVLDAEDLYWATDSEGGFDGVIWFDESTNEIFFSQDKEDLQITIEPEMVGNLEAFETDNKLEMSVMRESNFYVDPNSEDLNKTSDWNYDAKTLSEIQNDDDLLVLFTTNDEDEEITVIDFSDRGYNELVDYNYDNSVELYSSFTTDRSDNQDNLIMSLEDEDDRVLITPFSGTTYTVDWGTDNRIDAVDVCHPINPVDATYFIGTGEERDTQEDVITPDDEGTEVTAGCCTFNVKEFTLGVEPVEYTTQKANVVGQLVVAEAQATQDNLIVIGGPVVNSMCTLTKEEISAESDKYLVKKQGNLLFVAGYEAEDTITAGNGLVNWLYANIH